MKFQVKLLLLIILAFSLSACASFPKMQGTSDTENLLWSKEMDEKGYYKKGHKAMEEDLKRGVKIPYVRDDEYEKKGLVEIECLPVTTPYILSSTTAFLKKADKKHGKNVSPTETEIKAKSWLILPQKEGVAWTKFLTKLIGANSSCFIVDAYAKHDESSVNLSSFKATLKDAKGNTFPLTIFGAYVQEGKSVLTHYSYGREVSRYATPFYSSIGFACTANKVDFTESFSVALEPTFSSQIDPKFKSVTLEWIAPTP